MRTTSVTETFMINVLKTESISYQELYSSYHRVVLLINHTKDVVRENFTKEVNNTDARHYLIPALVSSIYCLASIYIEEVFAEVIQNTPSKSYNTWFEHNSVRLFENTDYKTLFEAYLINQFRHLVIVHSNNSEIPGHVASSNGDYELWYGSKHVIKRDEILIKISQIDELLSSLDSEINSVSLEAASSLYVIRKLKEDKYSTNEAVQTLFESLPMIKGTPLEGARKIINQLIQEVGCNSTELSKILDTIDRFLKALHESK